MVAGSGAAVSGAGVFGAWVDGAVVAVGVATGVDPAQAASAAKAKKRPTIGMTMSEGLGHFMSIFTGAKNGPSRVWRPDGEAPGP